MRRLAVAFLTSVAMTSCIGDDDTAETGETDDSGDSGQLGPLADDFESSLDSSMGCVDTWLHAYTSDGTIGMTLYRQGLFATVLNDGSLDQTLTVGVDELTLGVNVGTDMHGNFCTDDIDAFPVIDAEYTAVSGTVHILMTHSGAPSDNATAEFSLTNVVLESTAGHTVTVEQLLVSDILVLVAWGG